MAEEVKVEAVEETAPKPKKKPAVRKTSKPEAETEAAPVVEETPKKPAARKKKAESEAPKAEAHFAKATAHDYEVIVAPHITEKTMALMQNANKVTIKVSSKANKIEIKEAFQRIFQVKVTDIKIVNQIEKSTTRGGRYRGTISGFKKAIVTVADGEAIDLFKE